MTLSALALVRFWVEKAVDVQILVDSAQGVVGLPNGLDRLVSLNLWTSRPETVQGLELGETALSCTLSFSSVPMRVTIPYAAVVQIIAGAPGEEVVTTWAASALRVDATPDAPTEPPPRTLRLV